MSNVKSTASKSSSHSRQYVFCVESGEYADLQVRRVYRAIPEPNASAEGLMRIVDDSGDDYLYPSGYFVPVELPPKARRTFSK